jgi:hypothetical protein
MRNSLCQRAPHLFLALFFGAFLISGVSSSPLDLQNPEQKPPKAEKPVSQSNRETLIGILMRAEWKAMTQTTIPFPPVTSRSAPGPTISEGQTQLVTGDKGADLLVLHFSVRPRQCPMLDRQRVLVKDNQDKSYTYGAWGVDRNEYSYCNNPGAMIEIGPWNNTLWTPVGINPEYGFFDLVYKVERGATGLIFTDGVNKIDLDALILPSGKKKKK